MKFRLIEDFDDLLMEDTVAIEPGSELEKNLIYELENTNKSYAQIAKEYGLSNSTLQRFAKNRNLGDKRKFAHAIEPGSELEKNLIYDIENTDTPYRQLAKKYGLSNTMHIYNLIKSLNLNAIPRLQKKPLIIKPGSELENSLIYDIEHTDKSYSQLSKEYGIPSATVKDFIHRKNLRAEQRRHFHDKRDRKMHVYFNTLQADIHAINIRRIDADLKFFPSIYIGEYSVGSIESMYEYVRKKYFGTKPRCDTIIEFYLKIASNEISLNTLIEEMKAQSIPSALIHTSTFDYKFITASTEELSTSDFHSTNYSQLAKDILTFLSRKDSNSNDFNDRYKELKAAAAKLDSETFDHNNQIDTYVRNNLENIAHNVYSKKGDIIEADNYVNGIPYETSFDVSSPQDIARYLNQYKDYLLYGFMDKTGDIVYVGISVHAQGRGTYYSDENRPLILKAFKDKLIKKLIIFKSNLPVNSRSLNIKLIYALEVYFAEVLFKTYPENYPKALNKDKPGKNSSGFIASQNRQKFELYISKQDRLLSVEEFTSAGEELLNSTKNSVLTQYPYYKYAENYIAKHDGELSIIDKQTLYRSINSRYMYILWTICSSESEFKQIAQIQHIGSNEKRKINDWKNYRIENNLPITEDLDDDIDVEYYV